MAHADLAMATRFAVIGRTEIAAPCMDSVEAQALIVELDVNLATASVLLLCRLQDLAWHQQLRMEATSTLSVNLEFLPCTLVSWKMDVYSSWTS
jgi:hypothetical protein